MTNGISYQPQLVSRISEPSTVPLELSFDILTGWRFLLNSFILNCLKRELSYLSRSQKPWNDGRDFFLGGTRGAGLLSKRVSGCLYFFFVPKIPKVGYWFCFCWRGFLENVSKSTTVQGFLFFLKIAPKTPVYQPLSFSFWSEKMTTF